MGRLKNLIKHVKRPRRATPSSARSRLNRRLARLIRRSLISSTVVASMLASHLAQANPADLMATFLRAGNLSSTLKSSRERRSERLPSLRCFTLSFERFRLRSCQACHGELGKEDPGLLACEIFARRKLLTPMLVFLTGSATI